MSASRIAAAVVLAALSVSASAGLARADAEEPWRLTWEERMALRFGPEAATAR